MHFGFIIFALDLMMYQNVFSERRYNFKYFPWLQGQNNEEKSFFLQIKIINRYTIKTKKWWHDFGKRLIEKLSWFKRWNLGFNKLRFPDLKLWYP